MSTNTSFEVLPTEIASFICGFLRQSEVAKLSLAKQSIYQSVRPILYRHPDVSSFTSLSLFQRTLTQATYMGKADHKWSNQECIDQTRTLRITLDPDEDTKNNRPPIAPILIARMIQAIVRRCPNLSITLCFAHSRCTRAPVSALGSETFPRVTKLVLYVGRHDPDDPNPAPPDKRNCHPNAKFWRPLVNGESFPDCLNLELRHYWATTPPANASLNLGKLYPRHSGYYDSNHSGSTDLIGSTKGLKRFENITLECPPELNSSLLMQLLGNPNSVASNLKSLELRFCNLDLETISKLLYHAPPNLQRLVLLCWDSNQGFDGFDDREGPHLCPLIREFSKNLVHLEFAASYVCRELFFDDIEKQTLRQNGVTTGIGTTGGAIEGSENPDVHAIRETVLGCRRHKSTKYRNACIKEAINAAKMQSSSSSNSPSLFSGGPNLNSTASKAQRDTETLLDEEEEKRSRLIQGSKTQWFRRIIAWRGLCRPGDTWAEIQLAAELEEKGIEWVVANKELQVASQHSYGKLPVPMTMDRAFEEKFDFNPQHLTGPLASGDDGSVFDESEASFEG